MNSFQDDILGEIIVRRNQLSRSVRMRLDARGRITATAPPRMPMMLIKRAVQGARSELMAMKSDSISRAYTHGDAIGQSHKLAVLTSSTAKEPTTRVQSRTLIVTLPLGIDPLNDDVQLIIRDHVAKLLRKEAKAYLPKRLATLAKRYEYSYQTVRFPHAISRWGSCSTSGTISLNIALMKLPIDLIDYVILHELAHTVHMNHSREFWAEVERCDPHVRLHRRQIKAHSPII